MSAGRGQSVYRSLTVVMNVIECSNEYENEFKWNAPPIVGISLIPFFSHSSHHLFIPLSVAAGLLGLMLFLYVAERIEQKWADAFSFIERNKVATESDKLDIAG